MTATIGDAARHYAAGDLAETALVCLEIIQRDPRHFDALHLLGVVCTNRGQHADGVSYLLRAAALSQNNGQVWANLGSAYGAVQRFDKAVEAYRRALTPPPGDAGLLNNFGLALLGAGETDAAIETYLSALRLDPSHDPALYNLARARAVAGQYAEAEADYRRLLGRLPRDTPDDRMGDIANSFARALLEQGRAEDSLAVLRATATERPGIVSVQWHLALVLLLLGRYPEGWRYYERRFEAADHGPAHPYHRVLDLNRVAGQTVLVKEEQGRGDVIQFMRFLAPLAARGARLQLSVYSDLVPLAKELPEVELVLDPDQDEAEFDLLTSMMSLPLAFATALETIPARVPYLRVPASRIGRMTHHLGPASRRRIGLVWSGSTVSRPRAAMPAASLEPLLLRRDLEFHCLQQEILAEDRAWIETASQIVSHETMLRDFGDTAALVEAMDLVISIDTAVAHLAGALGRPVWIMLAFNPDWRWLLGRDDSPWYPTARLFRQPSPGDWDSVARAVATALPG